MRLKVASALGKEFASCCVAAGGCLLCAPCTPYDLFPCRWKLPVVTAQRTSSDSRAEYKRFLTLLEVRKCFRAHRMMGKDVQQYTTKSAPKVFNAASAGTEKTEAVLSVS